MASDWQTLTRLAGDRNMVVERVRLLDEDVAIEGQFELPSLARLSGEDQVFVSAFVRSHGSIKAMERLFGKSYPSVKNRLNRIADQLESVQLLPPGSRGEVLQRLNDGEITVEQAIEEMKQ